MRETYNYNGTEIKANFNKSGNIKLGGAIWSFSTLKGNEDIFIKRLGVAICGTCGGHCDCCTKSCYVNKSYRYDDVKYGHARNTIAIRYDLEGTYNRLNGLIDRAKNKPSVIRINQSGELENYGQLEMFARLASNHPEIAFFLYTKNYSVVSEALHNGIIPANMTILISIWHECGLKEYQRLSHYENIKAFVYDDGDFNYSENGLNILTWCKAYDESGKLDKNITCQKCKKCFNRNANCKCIGCKAH